MVWSLTTRATAIIQWHGRHVGFVKAVAFSPDGSRIMSTSQDTKCVCDAVSGRRLSTQNNENHKSSHQYDLHDPIIITDDGWILENNFSTPPIALSLLPPALLVDTVVASAAGTALIAFATRTELFIMHFPKQLRRGSVSPNTAAGAIRLSEVSLLQEDRRSTESDDDATEEEYMSAEEG